MMRLLSRLSLALTATLVAAAPPEAAQEIVTLDTRPSVTMKILLMTPNTSPKGAVILFPGGDGEGAFTDRKGKIRLSNNFLARSAELFAGEGFVTASADVPSDQSGGMSDQFRTSKERAVTSNLGSDPECVSQWRIG
jgi:hypothetical protein